jgi:hypothetical protein
MRCHVSADDSWCVDEGDLAVVGATCEVQPGATGGHEGVSRCGLIHGRRQRRRRASFVIVDVPHDVPAQVLRSEALLFKRAALLSTASSSTSSAASGPDERAARGSG